MRQRHVFLAALLLAPTLARGSSHMDASLITLDDAANTTDVYAFVSQRDGRKYLTAALSVYPFEEPGIGPNKYNFDDNVLYEIHVATGDDLAQGNPTYSYQFRFTTRYKNEATILQSYVGVVQNVDDAAQNLTQEYTVTRVSQNEHGYRKRVVVLGKGIVPPNNQGNATPHYNEGSNGENPSLDGVASEADLDRYTRQSIAELKNGYRAFAGQRDDPFYADIYAIFDLLGLRNPGVDSQKGFNLHTMVLQIPLDEIGGDRQSVGVYATTSRKKWRILRSAHDTNRDSEPTHGGQWVQVGRQGNPLFCEALVAIADKDLYSRTQPCRDRELFSKYAESPELAKLINLILFGGNGPAPETDRTDLAGIFIPDLIKVDLSTPPARLKGSGQGHPTNPDDDGFHRLGIFGGDVLKSEIQDGFGGGTLPGGWPNGRRFGDDVVDIAVTAILSDLRVSPPVIVGPAGDNVDGNSKGLNKVMPYAPTPLNGRNHEHH